MAEMTVVRQFSIFLLLSAVFFAACASKHPSDQALLSQFQSHRSEFNHLLQMFVADKELGRVAYNFTRPANPAEIGISEQRLQEYKQLFDKLGLTAGIEGYDEKEVIWFIASTQGLGVSGSAKGFTYLEKPPSLLVDSLDGYRSKDGKSFTAFRHLEGKWYLYLDYED